MTAKELIAFLSTVPAGYTIGVAFLWQGDVVLSDVSSACINGSTVQLNEEKFDKKCRDSGKVEYYQVPAVHGQPGVGKTYIIEDE